MTDLLSKEHSILERPFMEFRPFGLNDQGEKICDISGVIVQSNVDYMCDYLSRTDGKAAATQALDELCRLLNARLPSVTSESSANNCPGILNFTSTWERTGKSPP